MFSLMKLHSLWTSTLNSTPVKFLIHCSISSIDDPFPVDFSSFWNCNRGLGIWAETLKIYHFNTYWALMADEFVLCFNRFHTTSVITPETKFVVPIWYCSSIIPSNKIITVRDELTQLYLQLDSLVVIEWNPCNHIHYWYVPVSKFSIFQCQPNSFHTESGGESMHISSIQNFYIK